MPIIYWIMQGKNPQEFNGLNRMVAPLHDSSWKNSMRFFGTCGEAFCSIVFV